MQFVESSIVGLRSAVITLTHRAAPLTFTLFPMVHVGEQQFYDEVAARARSCQLVVAEGMPSKHAPAQEWMARHRRGPLVDQLAALRLETLGVPVRWEWDPDDQPKSPRGQLMFHAADVAWAAAIGLTRQFTDPRIIPSVDQAEEYDQSAEKLTGGRLERLMEHNIRTTRDAKLVRVLGEIHHDHAAEPMKTGVVFGAAHMPIVAAYLCGQLGYVATSAEWLIVAHARALTALSPLSSGMPGCLLTVSGLDLGQGLVEVGDQVPRSLDAAAEPDQVGGDAEPFPVLGAHAGVRGGGGPGDQCLHAAQARGDVRQLYRVQESFRGCLAAA